MEGNKDEAHAHARISLDDTQEQVKGKDGVKGDTDKWNAADRLEE